MKAKDFLRQYQKYEIMIRNKVDDIERLRELAKSITPSYGAEKVQSSGNQQKMESAIVKLIEKENEYAELLHIFIEKQEEILSVIEQLPPLQFALLHKIYIQNKGVAESAYELDKSDSWGATIHGRALSMVQKIIDEREN